MAADSNLLRKRLAAQALAGPALPDPLSVAERLLAVQGQDPRGARLAIRARTEGLAAADVDRALGEGSLLIAWLNRGTLHLVRSEDYHWLAAVVTPALLNESARRLAVEGIDARRAARAVARIERLLAEEGPMTRAALREGLERDGFPREGQAFAHVCFRAGVLGVLVRGPMIGAQHAYVLARDWLGEPPPEVERASALAELARRYLAGHSPAGDRDLARWAGLPLRDARVGLAAIASETVERDDGLLALRGEETPEPDLPAPRLLGAFDPVLLGWRSREAITGPHTEVVTTNGLFRPFAMVEGRAVATWRLVRGEVSIEPLARIAGAARAALESDAEDVRRFMGS